MTQDQQTDQQPTNPKEKPTTNKKKKLLYLVVIVLALVVIGVIIFGLYKTYSSTTIQVQGRVEADTVHVSTKLPSRIEEIYVHEGQNIEKGQALVRLSSPEIEAKRQQAEAALRSAEALQSTTERGPEQENINALYANWQSVKAQAELASTSYERGENLFQEGVISRQRRDELFTAKRSSAQLSEATYQQYARAKRGSTAEQKTMADANVDIAKAALKEAYALTGETELLAPISGVVTKTYGENSELVAPAVPIVSLIDNTRHWISLNVREDRYAGVYQKSSLKGYVPALNKTLDFKIQSIDEQGDFATLKTTRQTGGYDIRSFKLRLIPTAANTDLKVGMSVLFELSGSD